jgi:hypothetical protein
MRLNTKLPQRGTEYARTDRRGIAAGLSALGLKSVRTYSVIRLKRDSHINIYFRLRV